MSALLNILLATALVVLISVLSGKILLRWAGLVLSGAEEIVLGGVLGSSCLSGVTFVLGYAGLARRGVFIPTGAILIVACGWALKKIWRRETAASRLTALPLSWTAAFGLIYLLFGGMYLVIALAPETSMDGAGYYLSHVATWLRSHGFRSEFGTTLPEGIETAFLYASGIGHHSAATVVEWLYLMALPLGIILCARRMDQNHSRYAQAGFVAALMVFLSPIVARTGTIAASDVAIACVAFALFWLVQLPASGSRKRILISILGLFLAWTAVPWLQREAGQTIGIPGTPQHAWPLEIAVHGPPLATGQNGGVLGPLFLLAPLALFALLWPATRRVAIWGLVFLAVILAALPFNHVEARMLIPVLPFFALAIAMVVSEWRGALPMLAIAAVVMGWAPVISLYADDSAWRVPERTVAVWRAAFRQEPENHYLRERLRGYHSGSMLEERVAKGELVLLLSPFPAAYHRLRVLDASDKSTLVEGKRLGGIVTGVVDAVNSGSPSAGEMRTAAAQALKQAGVNWVVIDEDDPRAHEMFHQAANWGLTVRWIVEKIEVFKVN